MINLYPYQEAGVSFLASQRRAILADTMGLGKTGQAVAAADKVKAKSIVVICPAGVRINWVREFKRFSKFERYYHVINSAKACLAQHGVSIISYELATTNPIKSKLLAMDIDLLILDEAHFLKNRAAKRTEVIYGVHCKGDSGIVSRAKHVWALTGTPTPNHPGEIFSTLRAFGAWSQNYYAFEDKFCVVQEGLYGRTIVGMKNVDQLKELVKPIMLRRKVEDVMTELPKLTISDLVVSADAKDPLDIDAWRDAETGTDANKLRNRLAAAVDEQNLDLSNLALPTLRRCTGIAKVKPICELVSNEIDLGLNKIVIFCEHRDVIELARQQLFHHGAQVIYGGNTAEVKQQRINRFLTMWKYKVLIGHIKTLGTGVDGLQDVCNHAIFLESSWNPSDNMQAISRLRRNGQKLPVFIRFAALADSLDEHVQKIITRKTQLISQLLD